MAKSKKERSLKRVFNRVLLGVGVVAAFIIAFYIFAVVYRGDTKPILSVADQFKPGDSWKLTEESVEPPRIMCAGDVACPSVLRRWSRDKPLTYDELRSLMEATGWEYSIRGVCDPSNLDRYTCSVTAKDYSAAMSIYVWLQVDSSSHGQISIDIRRS